MRRRRRTNVEHRVADHGDAFVKENPMFHKILSRLLDYPDEALIDALPELRHHIRDGFEATEYLVLDRFMTDLARRDLTEAQATYVLTFDLTPEHSLHLTHHLFGEDKNRGPALIDLSEFYKEYGLELTANGESGQELPDFLPLMLEFAAQLETDEARLFLSRWNKVLNQLATNLETGGNPYAPLIRLIEQRAQLAEAMA
jgi:nitrate reductase delta subunit